jgi:hypothetical protein
MAKFVKWVVVAAVIAGVMVFLASRVGEQPLTRQEVPVSPSVLGK